MGHFLRLAGTFLFDSTAPFPDVPVSFDREWSVDSGSTTGKANKVFTYQTNSIAAAGTFDVDLTALFGPSGEFAPNYVASFIGWCITPGGTGTLTKHATNGWTGLGSAYTIPLGTGPFVLTSDAGIAITATDKVVTLTNNSAAAATYRFYMLLRDT